MKTALGTPTSLLVIRLTHTPSITKMLKRGTWKIPVLTLEAPEANFRDRPFLGNSVNKGKKKGRRRASKPGPMAVINVP